MFSARKTGIKEQCFFRRGRKKRTEFSAREAGIKRVSSEEAEKRGQSFLQERQELKGSFFCRRGMNKMAMFSVG